MQDRKLKQALDIYFGGEPDRETKEFQDAQKYLKLRIRPAMEFLIEKEDTEGMEQLENCGWFSAKELESFPVRRYHIDTNEHVNNCQYVQMALESLPKDKEVHQMRVEYKKSAVYGDVIYPRIAIEEDRTVIELCNEKARPYAVIEFKFA